MKGNFLSGAIPASELPKRIRKIGSVSAGFTETTHLDDLLYVPIGIPATIKEVKYTDVVSKHFIGWYFQMDDWVGMTPEQYDFSAITHSDEYSVYGYFNGSKLDGIIRVDDDFDYYELSFFYVNAGIQDQGVGQKLFRFVLDKFSDKSLILHVYTDNARAIHIYTKHGFRIVGTYRDMGLNPDKPCYLMQKDAKESFANISITWR